MKPNFLISFVLIFLCISCTLNVEETFIEGEDNKIKEELKNQNEPRINTNLKIPIV